MKLFNSTAQDAQRLKTNEGIVIHRVDLDRDPSAQLVIQNQFSATEPSDGAASESALHAAFQVGETALLDNGKITVQVTNHEDDDTMGDGYQVLVSDPQTIQATFLGQDTKTQGSWRGNYGAQGYWLQGDVNTGLPVNGSGVKSITWAANTTDPRALQKTLGIGRVAAAWLRGPPFTIDLDINSAEEVSVYALDFDNTRRMERIDVVDRATGTLLNSQSLTNELLGWGVSQLDAPGPPATPCE